MIENRTAEILAAIQNAARCTSDLLPLLETVRTDTSSKTAGERPATGARTEAGIVTDCPGPCESHKKHRGASRAVFDSFSGSHVSYRRCRYDR